MLHSIIQEKQANSLARFAAFNEKKPWNDAK